MKRFFLVLLAICLLLSGCGGQKADEVDATPVCIDGKWGYVNGKGEMVIDAKYTMAFDFSEGLAMVMIAGKCGYINVKGEIVIEPQYRFARAFAENGLAPVQVGELWGYIDRQGNIVIQPQFWDAEPFDSTGVAMVVTSDFKRATLQEDGTYTVLSDSEIVIID